MSSTASSLSRSRRLALAVLCAGMLMVILDGSIVTVALPVIQTDLGFSPTSLTWVLNAYLIAFGGLLPLAGRLGDLVGRKRTFIAGLATFTAASLLCGVSTDADADRRAVRPGCRRGHGIGGEPGHDRHVVPRAA
jgi:MFS family permease